MTDVFIRTYKKDRFWLRYCIASIHKYLTGHSRVIVCVPKGEYIYFQRLDFLKNENLVYWKPICADGYIDQQINKLMAHQYTQSDYILFIDSDVVFTQPTHIRDYFIDNKPFIVKTNYTLVGEAICWKESTERIMGWGCDYEYMRRIPLLYHRKTLERLNGTIDCLSLYKEITLSEFNLIGAFAQRFEPDNYIFLDTEVDAAIIPINTAKQYWSWGGITSEIRAELNEIIK